MNPEIDLENLTNVLPQDVIQYSIKPYYNPDLHHLISLLKNEDIPEDVINQYIKRVGPSEVKNGNSEDLLKEGIYYNTLYDILEEADLPDKTKKNLLQTTPLDQLKDYIDVFGALLYYDHNNEKELNEQLERLQESINNGFIDEIGTNTYVQEMLQSLAIEDFEPSDFEFKSSKKRKSPRKKRKSPRKKRKSPRRKRKSPKRKRKSPRRKRKSPKRKSKRKSKTRKSKSPKRKRSKRRRKISKKLK